MHGMQAELDDAAVRAELDDVVRPSGLILTPSGPPADAAVPGQWRRFLDEQAHGGWPALLDAWAPFTAALHSVRDFLSRQLQRLYVAREHDGTSSLLYLYTVGGRDLNVFRGRAPVARVPVRLLRVWDRVPARLRAFYTRLHDGWTFLPANSMGPLPLEDWAFLADDKFAIDAETARAMPIDIDRTVAVFHNGAGDYLCLHCADNGMVEAAGFIWWHEDPGNPEPVDFWDVLDAWLGIFFEEADRRCGAPHDVDGTVNR